MRVFITTVATILIAVLLTGCITSASPNLPYTELPEITVATEFSLVASPAHPTDYLPIEPIEAGVRVQVIGTDEDAAWLLVRHDDVLGWMPAFYSRTNIGTLEQALVFESPADKCTKFLDAVLSLDEGWTPGSTKSAIVVGSIFRDEAGERFDDASLKLEIDGPGTITIADYIHTPLTSDAAVVLFTYRLDGLQNDSRVSFELADAGDEPVAFQALFFENECVADLQALPVGRPRIVTSHDEGEPPQSVARQPTALPTPQPATPTPVAITRGSGPRSFSELDIALTIWEEDSDRNIYLREAGKKNNIILTTDSATDSFGSWSPDGTQFVFTSNRSGIFQLYIYDMQTNSIVQQITDSPGHNASASWSLTDPEIVYQEWDGKNGHLWKVDLNTMRTQRLTSHGINLTPHWSPDGTKVVFGAARKDSDSDGNIDFDDEWHLFVMDADGKNTTALTDDSDFDDRNPRWMPDGTHVAFSRNVKGDTNEENGPGEICIINVETGQVRTLTFTSADERWVKPSPLGDQFLITTLEDGYRELYIADWDGQRLGRQVQLMDGADGDWRPPVSDQ